MPGGDRPRRGRRPRRHPRPTLITFGGRDLCTSTRFAEPLAQGIPDSTVVVFDHHSHAGLHEDPDAFNAASLEFLLTQRG